MALKVSIPIGSGPRLRGLLSGASALLLALLPPSAWAQNYALTILESLGGEAAWATGINDSGQVVGRGYVGGESRAVYWSSGVAVPQNLGTFGGLYSDAIAINATGQVVGYAAQVPGRQIWAALMWTAGVPAELATPTPRAQGAQAIGINSAGVVVGFGIGRLGLYRAIIWTGGMAMPLRSLGGFTATSGASGINDAGQVVGYSQVAQFGPVQATLWDNDQVVGLETPAGEESVATAINNNGQVVGTSSRSGGAVFRASLWFGGTRTDLGAGPTGRENTTAYAINDSGIIVGAACASQSGETCRAMRWVGLVGVDLNTFLSANDIAAGWVLERATGINKLGWIVGAAYNSITGQTSPFLLSVTPSP